MNHKNKSSSAIISFLLIAGSLIFILGRVSYTKLESVQSENAVERRIVPVGTPFRVTLKTQQGFKEKFVTISVDGKSLHVEVAQAISDIVKGLGGRDEIGSDGMLFVLLTRSMPVFWMKDMLFPLDFVWIDGDKVIDLTENVDPQIGATDNDLKKYSPRYPSTHVLELNAGDIQKYGINIGDKVEM